MMVWIARVPPPHTHSTSHGRWTRNQRATSIIFGRSTQNTWMNKRKPQKQGLTRLVFENMWKLSKMSKNAENRVNWSFTIKVKGKGKGILLNVGGQTGKDCLLTWADGVKVADRRDWTRNLSLWKHCTNHCTTGPHTQWATVQKWAWWEVDFLTSFQKESINEQPQKVWWP